MSTKKPPVKRLSQDDKQLLITLETNAVNKGGVMDLAVLTEDQIDTIKKWHDCKFVGFGRVDDDRATVYHFELSDEAWDKAHKLRRQAYVANNGRKKWIDRKGCEVMPNQIDFLTSEAYA